MRVMGVDPGTLRMGVGVVDSISGELTTPFHGCLSPKRSDPIEQRLAYLLQELEDVIGKVSPDSVAVEEPFVSQNPKTAIAIGQAQAVVFLAAARHGIPVSRYAPTEVKKSVTDYGGSSKEQVNAMVCILLGNIEINGPDDVTDALAVAICHHNGTMLDHLIME